MGWVIALVVAIAAFGLVAWGASRAQRRGGDPDGLRRGAGEAEAHKNPPGMAPM
jgi:hypothetical protein